MWLVFEFLNQSSKIFNIALCFTTIKRRILLLICIVLTIDILLLSTLKFPIIFSIMEKEEKRHQFSLGGNLKIIESVVDWQKERKPM